MKRLGLVTIGQTPRTDLLPDIKKILGSDVEIIERGALDGLTLNLVKALYAAEDKEVLVTRMANGTEVKVSERKVFPRLKKQIHNLEQEGIKVVLLACTGEFPSINSTSLIIYPQRVLHHVVSSIAEKLVLGVLIPSKLQMESAKKRWNGTAKKVFVEAGSPYGSIEVVVRAAQNLPAQVDLIVMDCIGYTLAMKETIVKSVNKPVLLARSIAAKTTSEVL
jgi:protein AroM